MEPAQLYELSSSNQFRINLVIPRSDYEHYVHVNVSPNGDGATVIVRRAEQPPQPAADHRMPPRQQSSRSQRDEPTVTPKTPHRTTQCPSHSFGAIPSSSKGKQKSYIPEAAKHSNTDESDSEDDSPSCFVSHGNGNKSVPSSPCKSKGKKKAATFEPSSVSPPEHIPLSFGDPVVGDYIPWHRRQTNDDRRYAYAYAVPPVLRERYPPQQPVKKDIKEWYAVIVGYELGVFCDSWAYISAIKGSGFAKKHETLAQALAYYNDMEAAGSIRRRNL